MNDLRLECYQCQHQFEVEPDNLRPYHGAYIQGNRPPEYVLRCPARGTKNVMRLPTDAAGGEPIVGIPPRKR